jgi:hypothetical protein
LANAPDDAKFSGREGNLMAMRVAIAALIVIGCAVSSAASKTKAPPLKPRSAAIVDLENKRRVSLVTFEIVMPAKGKKSETVVGKLGKALSGGESASLPLLGAKGCIFEARWKFEDAEDAAPVDLCNNAHIILMD